MSLIPCPLRMNEANTMSTPISTPKLEVLLVPIRYCRQIDRGPGEVATLLAPQQTPVLDRALEEIGALLLNDEGNETVVNVDVLTHIYNLECHHTLQYTKNESEAVIVQIENRTV